MKTIPSFSFIVALIFSISPILSFSQSNDTITIHHKYYSTTFSRSKRIPLVVKYWLSKTMLECDHRISRSSKFKSDPALPEYTNLDQDYKYSGYDRGHQMAAYDCGCDSIAMVESFYYSNIVPQSPALNRGIWKKLEEYTRKLARKYDSILVYCGSVTHENRYVRRVSVPDYCWKIIYMKKSGLVKAYSFKNDIKLNTELSFFEVSADSIQHLSGFVFTGR